jgi:hypothetical protein
MIGAVLIGRAWVLRAWVYYKYRATAFWVGVASVVLVAIWSSGTGPLLRSTRRPPRTRLNPDPANQALRRRAHELGVSLSSSSI